MQPVTLLHNIFSKGIRRIHKKRLASLMDAVIAVLSSKKLTLTMLGRHMRGEARIRANIKKADRLLGNKHLQEQKADFYQVMNEYLMPAESHPCIHIDWSCVSSLHALYLLRASLSLKGRSLVVYEEVHPKVSENNHQVHKAFLSNLKKVLPTHVSPIIVTDAGFRAIWFEAVRHLDWDFIGRVRNNNLVLLDEQKEQGWQPSKALYEQASNKAKTLGLGYLTKSSRCRCEFVLYKQLPKGRSKQTKARNKCSSSKSKRYGASAKEPWLLVSSLPSHEDLALRMVKLYRTRMQIEESFRDTKSQRYGFGLSFSLTKSCERMSILLLIGAIAHFICWVTGLCVKERGQAKHYQAHSSKFTSALSVVYLGCEVLRKPFEMLKSEFKKAIEIMIGLSNTDNITAEGAT